MRVKTTQAEEANQSKHKYMDRGRERYLSNDISYKAKELNQSQYMIWFGKLYIGVFHKSYFMPA